MTADTLAGSRQGLLNGLPFSQGLSCLFAFAGLFLSPFYIWSSGIPQVAHLSMAAAVIIVVANGRIAWHPVLTPGLVFVCYAFVVNTVTSVMNDTPAPVLASVYYGFNILCAASILTLAFRIGVRRFLTIVYGIFWAALVIEAAIVVTRTGRIFELLRSMGTFNDPNQLAHWLLWITLSIVAIGMALRFRLRWAWLSLAFALPTLAMSASRSGSLGMVMVIAVVLSMTAVRAAHSWSRPAGRARMIVIGGGVLAVLLLTIALNFSSILDTLASAEKAFTLFNRFEDANNFSSLEGRGYDRIWKFPEYLLFGAGEAAHERWLTETWFNLEIHSTFASVAFCYGLVGLSLLLMMLLRLARMLLGWRYRLLLAAPLLYSVATFNLRNWLFWLGLTVLLLCGMASAQQDRAQTP